jgi:hypothetical protein
MNTYECQIQDQTHSKKFAHQKSRPLFVQTRLQPLLPSIQCETIVKILKLILHYKTKV